MRQTIPVSPGCRAGSTASRSRDVSAPASRSATAVLTRSCHSRNRTGSASARRTRTVTPAAARSARRSPHVASPFSRAASLTSGVPARNAWAVIRICTRASSAKASDRAAIGSAPKSGSIPSGAGPRTLDGACAFGAAWAFPGRPPLSAACPLGAALDLFGFLLRLATGWSILWLGRLRPGSNVRIGIAGNHQCRAALLQRLRRECPNVALSKADF